MDGERLIEVAVANNEDQPTGPLMVTPVGSERRRSKMMASIESRSRAVVTFEDEARAVISVSVVSLYDPKRWRAGNCNN